jgi:hypothetical protein
LEEEEEEVMKVLEAVARMLFQRKERAPGVDAAAAFHVRSQKGLNLLEKGFYD